MEEGTQMILVTMQFIFDQQNVKSNDVCVCQFQAWPIKPFHMQLSPPFSSLQTHC